MNLQKIGSYAFILGAIIAILAGIAAVAGALGNAAPWVGAVLVVIGIIIGFINIKEKEMTPFLVAAVALMVTSAIGWQYLNILEFPLGTLIQTILAYIGVFVAPAAVIVALSAVKKIASA